MNILNVGQCSFDNSQITNLVKKCGATCIPLDKASEIPNAIKTYKPKLILLNRIFDRSQESGLEVIKNLKADTSSKEIPVMLISNYPEAQSEAVTLGALTGFGKSELAHPTVITKIKKAIE